ncbi:MAG: tRNA uracil 4-sulfurtransferase ThiI [Clostridiales bacterium]
MKEILLVRIGEIVLKGLNRTSFERKLVFNIKDAIKKVGIVKVFNSQGRIYIEPQEENLNFDYLIDEVIKIFGVVSVSKAYKIKTDFDEIKKASLKYIEELLHVKKYNTFKVETKRGDKSFPFDSPHISREIGAIVLEKFSELSVDVKKPELVLNIEVRESSYIYSEKIKAYGGLPVGTSGKGLLLLSGGIDSPVAGWMMAKRGLKISAIHFYSYPYTSERSKEKVIDLTKIISKYCLGIDLFIVPFTDVQLMINDNFPNDLSTVILRRFMIRIANTIAINKGINTLVTGECLGQVASQTIQSINATNSISKIPILRPLIGMDKQEVINIALKIDTYETSILPYEDCCTIFVAKHPKTKPKTDKINEYEEKVEYNKLLEKAIDNTELIKIR